MDESEKRGTPEKRPWRKELQKLLTRLRVQQERESCSTLIFVLSGYYEDRLGNTQPQLIIGSNSLKINLFVLNTKPRRALS